MAGASAPTDRDIAEEIARVLRSNEETQMSVAEQTKLQAEAARLDRERSISVWRIAVSCLAAGAALFAASAAIIKVLRP